ncbi:MAG: hypothetical protein R2815_13990 [Flavobacteriales bacterium]
MTQVPAGAFTRLHLADSINNSLYNYAQPLGFRPWMRNGITFTGNSDQAYIGQRYYGNDSTDLVFQWSDNPGAGNYTPDRLRFIFTSNYSATRDTGAKSMEGLEALRMYPVDSFNVNVGIGDFWKAGVFAGSAVDPAERLDVLDGRVRIRQLPTEAEMDTVDKYVVVNEDGVLGWRPTTPGTGTDCDWKISNEGVSGATTPHHVWTAYLNASNDCPDKNDHVGIGTNLPSAAKLVVVEVADQDGTENGIHVTITADDETTQGIAVRNEPPANTNGGTVRGINVTATNGLTRTEGSSRLLLVTWRTIQTPSYSGFGALRIQMLRSNLR